MSIYNFKSESIYNFTDMSQEEFTNARRDYDYYLQSVLNRPINIDLNKERETVAQEIENENLAALDKTFENSVAANPATLNMYVNAYHGALPKIKGDPSISLEDAATGKFVADALFNNPRLFEEWSIDGYDVEANRTSTINQLYMNQALSNYMDYKQGQVTKVDYVTNLIEDLGAGSIYRTKAEQAFTTSVLGKEASFDTDIREEELRRLIYEKTNTMESEEFKRWFDENIINNIDRLDSDFIRGLSVITTTDMDEASDLYKLDLARRLQNGSTSGDQMMFNYGDFMMIYGGAGEIYDLATGAAKSNKTKSLKLQKLVNDDAGATKTAEELATAGDNAIVARESNYSATIGAGVASVPAIVDRPRVLANEVPHPIDVTPYEYKFYEKDYIEKNMYDNDNVINMYRDDQGIWTTDAPDTTIYQGQDKFTQIPYTDDAVAFTENPAPGYTRVVYGTGSDGKQAFNSYGEAERIAYDMTIDAAEKDGYIVVDAASYQDYKKPSFKAMGTGEGNNAYAEGPALYYSVREKGNDWLAARDHYYKMFKDVKMDGDIYNKLVSKFSYYTDDYNFVDDLEHTYNNLRSLYSYIYQQNKGNVKKASKEFMKNYNKAKEYFETHPDDVDDLFVDFGLDREIFKKYDRPFVDYETGARYNTLADVIIDTSYDEILNTPHPVIKTFIIPKKQFKGLVDEIEGNNKDIIKAFNNKYKKKFGENIWQKMEEGSGRNLTYVDVYRFVEDEERIKILDAMRKAGVQFNEQNVEKVATSFLKKPYRDVLQKRTLKELHKLGIYGSKHAKTNITLNTDKVQKNVATTTSTGLDGIITDMYTIENSKYWYTPIEINGRWYIQNTIRWNDKPIKMYKDGTIMEL